MANYKSIIDVESVAQATEEMNVLVEDAGSLKKVPAGGMIGGNGGAKMLVINYVDVSGAPQSLESVPTGAYTANMTFSEFDELLKSGEFAGGFLCQTTDTFYIFEYFALSKVFNEISYIYMVFNSIENNNVRELYFNSDNSITDYPATSDK